ncbi:MAG: IS200/IS605 family transposase [Gammaproteobacteria bacterium]
MRDWQSLAHVKWECKYHVVIVPKYRRKSLFGHVRKRIGKIFQQLCRQKEIELVEGHAMLDHVHMVLSIPPKLSVAMAVGYLKGKSAIQVHREALNVKQGFTGKHFWSRGYCVSTVGLDEQMIRAYVKNQDDLDRQEDLFNQ